MNSLGERHIIDCFCSCAKESFLKYRCKWNIGFRESKTQAHRKWSNSDTLTLEIEINVTFQDHTLENYLKTVDHYDAIRCSNTRILWIFIKILTIFVRISSWCSTFAQCQLKRFRHCIWRLSIFLRNVHFKVEFDHRQFLALVWAERLA